MQAAPRAKITTGQKESSIVDISGPPRASDTPALSLPPSVPSCFTDTAVYARNKSRWARLYMPTSLMIFRHCRSYRHNEYDEVPIYAYSQVLLGADD